MAVAGRVVSRREASKKLVFFDIESQGERVQALSTASHASTVPTFHSTVQVMASKAAYSTENQAQPLTWTHTAQPTLPWPQDEFQALAMAVRRGDIVGVEGHPA